jgi:hypothetical protein
VQAVARAGVNIRSVYDYVNYLPTPRFVVARGLTEERLLKELDRTFAATPQQTDHGVHIPCAWELAMALGAVTTRRSAEAVLQVLRNRQTGEPGIGVRCDLSGTADDSPRIV